MKKQTLIALASLVCLASTQVMAEERGGKQVVDQICGPSCHFEGKKGAPMISDMQAWSERAKKGMSAMTTAAIRGIREMPAHGGKASVSDIELSRAIHFMVTGKEDPGIDKPFAAPVAMTGKELAELKCQECHSSGKDGAPRMGHLPDWAPRLSKGIDAMVTNAVHGHKKMPARAGMATLSDAELKLAATYMFSSVKP